MKSPGRENLRSPVKSCLARSPFSPFSPFEFAEILRPDPLTDYKFDEKFGEFLLFSLTNGKIAIKLTK